MTEDLQKVDYLILDVLLDDVESPADILRLMNHPEAGFLQEHSNQPYTELEIERGLFRLLERRFVVALGYSSRDAGLNELEVLDRPLRECWFKLTLLGKEKALKPFPWS